MRLITNLWLLEFLNFPWDNCLIVHVLFTIFFLFSATMIWITINEQKWNWFDHPFIYFFCLCHWQMYVKEIELFIPCIVGIPDSGSRGSCISDPYFCRRHDHVQYGSNCLVLRHLQVKIILFVINSIFKNKFLCNTWY